MSTQTSRLSRRSRAWRPSLRSWRSPAPLRVSSIAVAIGATALVLVAAIVVVCMQSMAAHQPAESVLAAAVTLPGGDVSLPKPVFADGQAKFYRYVTATGREARFFVIGSSDGPVRAAFDACDNCFRQRRGFRQEGNHFVCNECGRTILPHHVGVQRDGCHPAVLEHAVDGDRIVVRAAALERGASYF